MEKKKNNKGITLIALVITIIVLLILAGVTITTLTGENGILTQATKAKDKTTEADAIERVRLEVLGSYGTNGEIELDYLNDNLKSNIPGLTYDEKEITEKGATNENRIQQLPATVVVNGVSVLITANGNTSIVEVSEELNIGDTVTYIPAEATYTWLEKYSSEGILNSTLSNTSDDYKVTSWRVFNINEDGTVDLIAEQPTNGTVNLSGAQGYNNSVKLLNDACNTLYGNSAKGITGRSINIEDIEGKMTEEALNGDNGAYNYSSSGAKYGEQKATEEKANYSWHPLIYEQENLSVVGGKKITDGLGLSEQPLFIEPFEDDKKEVGCVTAAISIQPYQTYWFKDSSFMQTAFTEVSSDSPNMYYDLIMPLDVNTNYWIASRCVSVYSVCCDFRHSNGAKR